jgi:hypothetical protein
MKGTGRGHACRKLKKKVFGKHVTFLWWIDCIVQLNSPERILALSYPAATQNAQDKTGSLLKRKSVQEETIGNLNIPAVLQYSVKTNVN